MRASRGSEFGARHGAKLAVGYRLGAEAVFAFGGEIDEFSGKGKTHDLALAIGERLVEPQQTVPHPMDMGCKIRLQKGVLAADEHA
jgi:hypothetical protein